MTIIYPRPPEECPSYLQCGSNEWRNEVRIANNFGKQSKYNVGDNVETISFYFANSESHKQNQVIIEKGVLEYIKIYNTDTYTDTSYHVKCNNCTKITSLECIRPTIPLVAIPPRHLTNPSVDLFLQLQMGAVGSL